MKNKNITYERTENYAYYNYIYWFLKKSELEIFKETLTLEKSDDGFCWVCDSIGSLLDLMEQTVMIEGKLYIDKNGITQTYPLFREEDYIIIKFECKNNRRNWYFKFHNYDKSKSEELNDAICNFDFLQIGTKGDLKLKKNFTVISVKKAYDLDTSHFSY
ncbi:MAG: hypothetical protein R3Y35_13435 [Clostridia bacterium]